MAASDSATVLSHSDVNAKQSTLASALRLALAAVPGEPDRRPDPSTAATLRRLEGVSIAAAFRAGQTSLACDILTDLAATQAALRERMLTARSQLLCRIHDELAVVRRETTTAAVMAHAPGALCSAGGFDRAMISSLRGSTWVPQVLQAVAGADSPVNTALRALVPGVEIPLSPSMVESELVRRKVPALVDDARSDTRLFRPLVAMSRTRAYVVAPIIVTGSVVGLMHADTYWSGRELHASDRDSIQAFADGLGLILERTIMLERLALQRKQVAEALSGARTATDDAGRPPERLSRTILPPPGGPSTSPRSPLRLSGIQSTPAGLTPREQQVLGHLVGGATNAQIADRLSVSETTVKTHVKHILRKLRASNRAEAIARFLRLTRSQDRLQ